MFSKTFCKLAYQKKYRMKLKIVVFLLSCSFLVSSCNKKQCPAYGSVDKKAAINETKTT